MTVAMEFGWRKGRLDLLLECGLISDEEHTRLLRELLGLAPTAPPVLPEGYTLDAGIVRDREGRTVARIDAWRPEDAPGWVSGQPRARRVPGPSSWRQSRNT